MRNAAASAKSNSSEKSISPLMLRYQRMLQERNGARTTGDAKASTPFPSIKKKLQGNVHFGHKDAKKTPDSKPKAKVTGKTANNRVPKSRTSARTDAEPATGSTMAGEFKSVGQDELEAILAARSRKKKNEVLLLRLKVHMWI
ncbi:hypothetical protein PsorP6_002978 [Peronosclerospora sorghi]|uniref:Uncharacterized protein n=1 Tax=Peronosclerospora sorghi TaxID=230839 RepID=A0ACC0VKQ3_9STRA|nr:hypothetical protein PsorP6_002978 [Peronosclerospora sorghi]